MIEFKTCNRPNLLIFKALSCDYSEVPISTRKFSKSEKEYSYLIVKNLLANDRGHFGCLEHCPVLVENYDNSNIRQLKNPYGIEIINDTTTLLNMRSLLRVYKVESDEFQVAVSRWLQQVSPGLAEFVIKGF